MTWYVIPGHFEKIICLLFSCRTKGVKNVYYIYSFRNKINGKSYIGSTNNLENRKRQHYANSINDNSDKYYYPLYCAFRKYGIDNFEFLVLEEVEDKDLLLERESYLIQSKETLSPKGYNQTLETFSPMRDSDISDKVAKTKREKYGKEVVEINKKGEIVSRWKSIVECAEQTGLDRFKISAVCNGSRHTTGGRIFRFIENDIINEVKYNNTTSETRVTKSSRKIAKFSLEGAKLEEYPSVQIAANENACDASGISKVCGGKRKTCGGFIWKYID